MFRSPTDKHDTCCQSRTLLLATDQQNSVLAELAGGKPGFIAYCAYGEQSAQREVDTTLGFNGERRETNFGWYLLGNGYRAYNPKLMRFHSPDSWSPFGNGGLNTYMYCVGDPVNFADPTGHAGWGRLFSGAYNFFLGGPDVTGPSRRKALVASAPFGSMKPEKTGEMLALADIGAIVAFEPPPPRMTFSAPLSSVDAPVRSAFIGNGGVSPAEELIKLGEFFGGPSTASRPPLLPTTGPSAGRRGGDTWTSTIHGSRYNTHRRLRGGGDPTGNRPAGTGLNRGPEFNLIERTQFIIEMNDQAAHQARIGATREQIRRNLAREQPNVRRRILAWFRN
jgi:RHS repeat-associated protein